MKSISVVSVVDGVRLSREQFVSEAGKAFDVAMTSRNADSEKIAKSVSDLFDTNKGVRLNQSYINTMVLRDLGCTPETITTVTERIVSFVQANKGEQGDGKLFASQKGRNGGTWRQCDYVAPVKSESK